MKKVGRPSGKGKFEGGQRFTIRLPQALAQRLLDRARGRADRERQPIEGTYADVQQNGQISDIIREAIEHYLNGCDREITEAKPR